MSHQPQPQPGISDPLGAHADGRGVNFAVFAPNAKRVELCLFDSPTDAKESVRVDLPERTGPVWHGYYPGLTSGQLYGYRAHGVSDPKNGLRFNPAKLLFDPYARAIGRELRWDDSLFGFPAADGLPETPAATLETDIRDSAAFAPLAAVPERGFDWHETERPRTPWRDTVIYEAHAKGLTIQHPDVPTEIRGTYAALGSEPIIRHLKDLGVTALELLPVHHFASEPHLTKLGLSNYWGYNTLAFFAPHPGYARDQTPHGPTREFKEMVRSLHRAGIEVLIDVVYNHTCEGNHRGPTVSWRGLANAAYYRLPRGEPDRYVNFSGTGNTLDIRHPYVLKMVMDSLRYWVEEMHVDGFRFDLASVLGRGGNGFHRDSGFFAAVNQDAVLSQVKLIAEPWDLGPGGYRVGGYPTGWSEWNGRYRDDVRSFWRGDAHKLGAFATRFAGSADLYQHSNREPSASVNFIIAHDGFTLRDLVSYENKRNLANGEDNRDGEGDNTSRNYGAEGPTEDETINAVRLRQQKNMLATLLLSAGTPMLAAGDELGRSQQGNNNAYCQDSELAWVDWDLSLEQQDLQDFVRKVSGIRRNHPTLRRREFYNGKTCAGSEWRDIAWYSALGRRINANRWAESHHHHLVVLIGPAEMGEPPLLYMINTAAKPATFQVPLHLSERRWKTEFDTGNPGVEVSGGQYELMGHASALLSLVDLVSKQ